VPTESWLCVSIRTNKLRLKKKAGVPKYLRESEMLMKYSLMKVGGLSMIDLAHRRGALQGRSQLIGHPGLMGCAHGEQQHNPMLQAACRSIIRLDFSGLVCWLQRLAAGNHPRPVVRWSPRDPQANRSLRIL